MSTATLDGDVLIEHTSCPECGSSDARAVYGDGHSHCFACNVHFSGSGKFAREETPKELIDPGEPSELRGRRVSLETARRYGYHLGHYGPMGSVQIANYRDERGRLIAQKIRGKDKNFVFLGDTKRAVLFGRHLVRDGGKMLVITEGEIDALSVTEAMGLKWPAVSLPNGAAGAKKAIKANLQWLEKFERVVLAFDMDEPGREAAEECAALLSPGKAYLAILPEEFKDASEMLQAGKRAELVDAIWGAKEYRPDGIISGAEVWDQITRERDVDSTPYPWQSWNRVLLGLRKREVVTLTAGSGIGKSQFAREIAYHLIKRGDKLGYIALEESVGKTGLELMGLELGRRLHISREGVSEADLRRSFDATVGNGRVWLYDHFGSLDIANLIAKVSFLAKGHGVDWVILDHVSIVVSGLEDGDERRMLDNVMTGLRSLAQNANVGLLVIAHLKRPKEGSYNEGRQISLTDLRGSAALEQLSDIVIGLERNQQNEKNKHLTKARVLKNRFTGETGEMGVLRYDPATGRLAEADAQDYFDEEDDTGTTEF